jgi:hypothetical protein
MADAWANTVDDTWGNTADDLWTQDATIAVSVLSVTSTIQGITVALSSTVAVSLLSITSTAESVTVSVTQDVTVPVSQLGMTVTENSVVSYYDSFVNTGDDHWLNLTDIWYGLSTGANVSVSVSLLTLTSTIETVTPTYDWTVYIGDALTDEAGNVIRGESGVPVPTEAPLAPWTMTANVYPVTASVVADKTVAVSKLGITITLYSVTAGERIDVSVPVSALNIAIVLEGVTPEVTWVQADPLEVTGQLFPVTLSGVVSKRRRRGLLTGVY